MKRINTGKIITNNQILRNTGLAIILVFSIFKANAQQQNLPLGDYFKQKYSFEINKTKSTVHTGFKPFLKSDFAEIINIDSVLYEYQKSLEFFKTHKKKWIWRKLFFEDFITVKKDPFSLYINPLFYLEKGMTSDQSNLFINTRGIEIKGDIGKKVSYYSSFRENQARFRNYIYDWSWERLVVPGQGALKKNNIDLSKFDFSGASAYLSYSPCKWFNLQIGQDKHFIGEGHRSLFLSDNAFNYPFAKLTFNKSAFKYITMITEFRDFEGAYYDYHFKKHAAFNYLSYNYRNFFELGLFEGIIYRTTDTSQYVNNFKADLFIPLPGLRSAFNGFNSEHNLLVGANMKVKITHFVQLYGQFAIDDPNRRKYAYQSGLMIFDVFHSKFDRHHLYLQTEYTYVLPGTYSHSSLKYQSWTHYNQELALNSGCDFAEFIFTLNYHFSGFYIDYSFIKKILNNKNTVSNILIPDDDKYLISSDQIEVFFNTCELGYTVNPRTGLQLFMGINRRSEHSDTKKTETFFRFGLKTCISNFYYDF